MNLGSRNRHTLVGVGLALSLLGCGGGQADTARTYVGLLEDGPASARIGLVTRGSELLAYVSSGEQEFNRRNCRWFSGKLSAAGTAEVALEQGPKLAAAIKPERAEGTLTTAEGKPLRFQATAVAADGNAGVYRVKFPNGNTLGWIVDETGFVGGAEVKGKDGITLGFWASKAVPMSSDEQRAMMALTYQGSPISAAEIQRVTAP